MWRLLQLCDSAFPTGGFAHSSGLEAAQQLGELDARSLPRFLDQILWQAGRASLPLCNGAFDTPDRLPELDGLCDAFLSSQVANRASRTQGRALAMACARAFDVRVAAEASSRSHLAPLFGALVRALGVPREDMQRVWLHVAVRGALSAAVRLGLVGPYEGQRLQARMAGRLDEVAQACAALGPEDLAQPAPLLELCGSVHDRLYSRLFQS